MKSYEIKSKIEAHEKAIEILEGIESLIRRKQILSEIPYLTWMGEGRLKHGIEIKDMAIKRLEERYSKLVTSKLI